MTDTPKVNSLRGQDVSYRRGVLLGMTMAEIMILLLFCILMAFILRLEDYEVENDKAEKVAELEEVLTRDGGTVDDAWEFITTVTELARTLGIDGLTELVDSVAPEVGEDKQKLARALAVGLEHYREAEGRLREQLGREPTVDEVEKAILVQSQDSLAWKDAQDDIAIAQKLANTLGEGSESQDNLNERLQELLAKADAWDRSKGSEPEKSIKDLIVENKMLSERGKRLEVALDIAEKQLKSEGQGLQYPSCFVDESGKIQFIYDVYFDESQLLLNVIPVTGYNVEREVLPFDRVAIDTPMDINTYLRQTAPLHAWSVDNKCRFWVKVYDQTAAENKSQYKWMKRRIEYRFYVDESLRKPSQQLQ
jgi:hypothetical protein